MTGPLDDAVLGRVLVGGLRPGPVELVPPDAGWPTRFERHRSRLAAVLGDRARGIEHIGSTAVPGLAAKDIVDVAVGVDDPEDPGLVADLEVAGYELRVSEPGHRCLRGSGDGGAANVHLYPRDGVEIRRYRAFRDRLRSDAGDRRRYEEAKRALADRPWRDVNYYAEAKGPVIAEILAAAGWED